MQMDRLLCIVYTLKTEKTQDDFSVYMAYVHMRGKN